jgi:hypothetical protein
VRRRWDGPGVAPLAQRGLNKPVGFAIGARRVRPREQLADAVPAARRGERPGAIGRAVVGHDALDPHAKPSEPGERPVEEGAGAWRSSGRTSM